MPFLTAGELVTAALAGDRAAFGSLVERHRPALLRACSGSADVAQDAVLEAMTGLGGLRDHAAFGPWLCGIGRNLARREHRAPAPVPLDAVPEPAGPEPRADDGVWAAVAALPPGQRDAVALFYL